VVESLVRTNWSERTGQTELVKIVKEAGMALLILPCVIILAALGLALGWAVTFNLGMILLLCCSVSMMVIQMVASWTVYTKAGQPGWTAFIPIYNFVVLCRIAGHSGWWVLLLLVPLVNIVVPFIVHMDVARKFGRSVVFGICLTFFDFICMPILAFSESRYDPRA
jgi:hypothetical protein